MALSVCYKFYTNISLRRGHIEKESSNITGTEVEDPNFKDHACLGASGPICQGGLLNAQAM